MFRNCILITIDSLRVDHLGCYGYKQKISPNIDMLAKNGIFFTNAYANGPCTPVSFPAILSSTYPMMYGGYKYFSKKRKSIAELLNDNGIHTIGIHSNPYLSKKLGYNRGYNIFYDGLESSTIQKLSYFVLSKLFFPVATASRLTSLAKKHIENVLNKRFFIWIHYMDVHLPYSYHDIFRNLIYYVKIRNLNNLVFAKIKEAKKQSKYVKLNNLNINELIELYDEGIKYIDKIIGEFIDWLDRRNILEETLIIITSDHGEEFMEHGGLCHLLKLYDELLHIPLIIYNPCLTRKNKNFIVDQLDIAPTIAESLGLKKHKTWLGRSLLKNIKDKEVISEVATDILSDNVKYSEWKIAIRTKKWKLHYFLKDNRFELYNIIKDPNEMTNLADIKSNIVDTLKPKIKKYIELVKKTNLEEDRLKIKIKQLRLSGKI